MRRFGVLALVVTVAALLGACGVYCDPCPPKPCAAPPPPPPPPPCPAPCPAPCASPCNEPNPCAPPPCDPCAQCTGDSKPCTCWPDYGPPGSPTARALLDEVIAQAIAHIGDVTCVQHRPSWVVVRNNALSAKTHGATCRAFTCQQYWNIVNSCHAAVMQLAGNCAPAPAACSELNHADPTNFGG